MEVKTFSLEECTSKDEIFDTIFTKSKELLLKNITGKTFAVRIKRSGMHAFNSIDIERYI
jgi:adenylyl- and sulfurtransferase ThiI